MAENSPLRYEVGAIEDWTIAAVRRAVDSIWTPPQRVPPPWRPRWR
jgi:hypothetical protein